MKKLLTVPTDFSDKKLGFIRENLYLINLCDKIELFVEIRLFQKCFLTIIETFVWAAYRRLTFKKFPAIVITKHPLIDDDKWSKFADTVRTLINL